LCPFARIANEAIVEALAEGADWDVDFRPFSLAQSHVKEDETDVWDRPAGDPGSRGVVALDWSVAIKELFPERFAAFHVALFDARHSHAADVDDEALLRELATAAGIDAEEVAAHTAAGLSMKRLAAEHAELVDRWGVFGVPTFIHGDEAVFVRLMERHQRTDVEKVLDMLEWPRLNEFKRTRIPR
jgi:protein-disulfide isomerase-like protein with CxxC motif